MPKVGTIVTPVNAKIIRGGRATEFCVGVCHFVPKRGFVSDGYVYFMVQGEYHWEKGDRIRVTEITGWRIYVPRTRAKRLIMYAKIEFMPKESFKDGGEIMDRLKADVPEEYYG